MLKALLERSLPKEFRHIKNYKTDLVEVNLAKSTNPEYPFMCPISQKDLNGTNRFVAMWS